MFKKLFASLLGKEEEVVKPQPVQYQTASEQHQAVEEEHDEIEELEGGYDNETGHGLHYSKEAFDAVVQQALNNWLENEADESDKNDKDIRNAQYNLARNVFSQWNPNASQDALLNFQQIYQSNLMGLAVYGKTKHDDCNPMLEPIHGISLQDYSAAMAKISQTVDPEAISRAFGVERPVWDEATTLWAKRMEEDSSFTVINLFGKYFGEANQHPVIGALCPDAGQFNQENMERIKTDRYSYEELNAARQAAYDYGMAGAQWIQSNYGIDLGTFQGAACVFMEQRNTNMQSDFDTYMPYYEEQLKKYKERFAGEQGGNVADGIDF